MANGDTNGKVFDAMSESDSPNLLQEAEFEYNWNVGNIWDFIDADAHTKKLVRDMWESSGKPFFKIPWTKKKFGQEKYPAMTWLDESYAKRNELPVDTVGLSPTQIHSGGLLHSALTELGHTYLEQGPESRASMSERISSDYLYDLLNRDPEYSRYDDLSRVETMAHLVVGNYLARDLVDYLGKKTSQKEIFTPDLDVVSIDPSYKGRYYDYGGMYVVDRKGNRIDISSLEERGHDAYTTNDEFFTNLYYEHSLERLAGKSEEDFVRAKSALQNVIVENPEMMEALEWAVGYGRSFNSAFGIGRKLGLKEFMWEGKKYHTKHPGE